MENYFLLIGLITSAAVAGQLIPNIKSRRLWLVYFGFALIILLQSLRHWTVGTDIVTYVDFFERLTMESVSDFSEEFSSVEPGFLYYNKLIGLLTLNYQVFLGIVSATIFIPIGYVVCNNSKNIYLSLISLITLGIFNFTFSGIRQSIAIGLAFLSFELIRRKKWFWFVLLILFASTFHQSALIFLIAYPLYFVRIQRKHLSWVLLGVSVIFFLRSFLVPFFVSALFDKYDNSELFVETGAYTLFILMLALYVITMLANKTMKNSVIDAYSNYLLVAVLIQIAASESQTAMRAGYYFWIFTVLLIPELISTVRDQYKKDVTVILTLVFCFVFYYKTTVNGALNPFLFYWQY